MQRITLRFSRGHVTRLLTASTLVLLPATALAQPFSQSMAQCAGLYGGLVGKVTRPDRVAALRAGETAYYEAAINAARAEGQADPATWVDTHYGEAFDDWANKPDLSVFTQEFRDWSAYCLKFAASQGIELPQVE